MKVLFINTLHIKVAGNQALYNSLVGLAQAGHEVICLQIRGESLQPEMGSLHPGISMRHYRVLPQLLRRLVLGFYKLLRGAEALAVRRRSSVANVNSRIRSTSITPLGYQPAAPESIVQTVIGKFHWALFQVLAVWHGAGIIRREGVDVIYGYESWGAPAASVLGRFFHLPVVTRFQGTFLYPMMQNKLKRLMFFDRVLALKRHADLVVMANDGTRGDEVLKYLGVPESRVLFVTNGVAIPSVDGVDREQVRQEIGVPPGCFVLLTVSKLAVWKRIDRVIQALPRVLEVHPNTLLVVIGDGSERDRLARLAQEKTVDHAVRFVGAVPHSDVRRYYRAADVFVSTYDLSNRGNPVLEAMAHGCCIVTLADGSTDDLIAHGESAVLIDGRRISEELPEAIISLLNDSDLRSKLGREARNSALEKLMSWEERNRMEVERIESLVGSSWNAEHR